MITRALTTDPLLAAFLREHPRVESVEMGGHGGVVFWQGDWRREIVRDEPAELFGLPELCDNNPMVCADRFSLPSVAGSLALIALGPLAAAGLIADAPTLLLSFEADSAEVDRALASEGWRSGTVTTSSPQDLGDVAAAVAIVEIPTPASLSEIDELYAERFARSFYVHEEDEWDTARVLGTPLGIYRMRINPDEPNSLLTVQAMADRRGKVGPAQIVHAMNVMAGFEESLGIPARLS